MHLRHRLILSLVLLPAFIATCVHAQDYKSICQRQLMTGNQMLNGQADMNLIVKNLVGRSGATIASSAGASADAGSFYKSCEQYTAAAAAYMASGDADGKKFGTMLIYAALLEQKLGDGQQLSPKEQSYLGQLRSTLAATPEKGVVPGASVAGPPPPPRPETVGTAADPQVATGPSTGCPPPSPATPLPLPPACYLGPYQETYPQPDISGKGAPTTELVNALVRKHFNYVTCGVNVQILSVNSKIGAVEHNRTLRNADQNTTMYPVRSDVELTCWNQKADKPGNLAIASRLSHFKTQLTFEIFRNSFGEWDHTAVGASYQKCALEYTWEPNLHSVKPWPNPPVLNGCGEIGGLSAFNNP